MTAAEPEPFIALRGVVDVLEALGVAYYVTGSVVSSHFGLARSTADVDVVADLRSEHAQPFAAALEATFYVDVDSVREAIRARSMFNVLHLATMVKVDLYAIASSFDRETLTRAQRDTLADDSGELALATAEDIVLHKLRWFHIGGGVSERQWGDIAGVLRVQGATLDRAYLQRWSAALGLGDLLSKALAEAAT